MKTRFALCLGGLLALSFVSGCGARPGCVIDTDCPLGQFCSAEQHCELVGADHDSGSPAVDAARADAGAVDAAGADSGSVDSGATDAGARDAGSCSALLGTYPLMSSPAACPTVIAGITVAAGATSCELVISSREKASFGGTMTGSPDGRYTGTLSIGTSSYPSCTLTFPTPGALNIDCGGGCVLPAAMP